MQKTRKTRQEHAAAEVKDERGNERVRKRSEEASSFSSSSSSSASPSAPPKDAPAPTSLQLPRAPTSSWPPPFAPATRAGGERRPVGRRAPHRRRGAQAAWAQERPVSAEGKSVVAPGPAAPAPSGHRAAPLSWLSSVPVGRSTSHASHHGCDEGRQPAPLRRSAARAEASSAAVAPFLRFAEEGPSAVNIHGVDCYRLSRKFTRACDLRTTLCVVVVVVVCGLFVGCCGFVVVGLWVCWFVGLLVRWWLVVGWLVCWLLLVVVGCCWLL